MTALDSSRGETRFFKNLAIATQQRGSSVHGLCLPEKSANFIYTFKGSPSLIIISAIKVRTSGAMLQSGLTYARLGFEVIQTLLGHKKNKFRRQT